LEYINKQISKVRDVKNLFDNQLIGQRQESRWDSKKRSSGKRRKLKVWKNQKNKID